MTYGNFHHVEILRNKESGRYYGEFVTMLEASHRVRGIGVPRQPVVNTSHGDGVEFVMALHINDMVEIEQGGGRKIYRVQVLENDGARLVLRLHTEATIKKKSEPERIRLSISSLMRRNMRKIRVNAIGKCRDD